MGQFKDSEQFKNQREAVDEVVDEATDEVTEVDE